MWTRLNLSIKVCGVFDPVLARRTSGLERIGHRSFAKQLCTKPTQRDCPAPMVQKPGALEQRCSRLQQSSMCFGRDGNRGITAVEFERLFIVPIREQTLGLAAIRSSANEQTVECRRPASAQTAQPEGLDTGGSRPKTPTPSLGR